MPAPKPWERASLDENGAVPSSPPPIQRSQTTERVCFATGGPSEGGAGIHLMRTNKHMRPSGHHRSFTRALITRPTCVPCAVARTLTRGSGALEVAATVTGSAPEVSVARRTVSAC